MNELELMSELESEKRLHKYWHTMCCVFMSILGGTWGGILGFLLIWLLNGK